MVERILISRLETRCPDAADWAAADAPATPTSETIKHPIHATRRDRNC
jgi:hypothetical protein